MVYRPLWQKIARTPMNLLVLKYFLAYLGSSVKTTKSL